LGFWGGLFRVYIILGTEVTWKAGIKFDTGKPEYGLIPPNALEEIAKVLTYGAQKYSRDNWKQVPDKERRYFDAMQRHIWAHRRGEVNDPETGMNHLAHAACCILYLAEFDLSPEFKPATNRKKITIVKREQT
jgi:hypothetical protein